MAAMAVRTLVAACLLAVARSVPADELIKGISYGPAPCKRPCQLPQDDFMSEAAKPMWGPRGRADLLVMQQLGANSVRLYGNNPANDHRGFLNEAHTLGLHVTVGISDYPYFQMSNSCATTEWNCYIQVRLSYLENLQKGFLLESGAYHPTMREVIVINEPDLKLGGQDKRLVMKGIISAVDGMLDAEKEAGVTGNLVNFTATMSFATCIGPKGAGCGEFGDRPALGQMFLLREAFMDPKAFGYEAKNDLAEFYRTRWANSFNTANPARDIRPMFLDEYETYFPTTPVSIEEFHAPMANVTADMPKIVDVALNSSLLKGVSFFEFQVRADKGGSEEEFGMFSLGSLNIVEDGIYYGMEFGTWCLVPVEDHKHGGLMANAVATAYGGRGVNYSDLCIPDPRKVRLDGTGFAQIAAQQNPERMALFVDRVLRLLRGLLPRRQRGGGQLRCYGRSTAGTSAMGKLAPASRMCCRPPRRGRRCGQGRGVRVRPHELQLQHRAPVLQPEHLAAGRLRLREVLPRTPGQSPGDVLLQRHRHLHAASTCEDGGGPHVPRDDGSGLHTVAPGGQLWQ